CGFQSRQTFNRVFKEPCGMTPMAYRKRALANCYKQWQIHRYLIRLFVTY
ncbi:MAG: AraC family transcriptional regulator, partial [Acutalibacteraceae bacterium]